VQEERTIFFDDQTADFIARGGILAMGALLWVTLLVRVVGLHSFSKMTSFDFVMTIAMGSLVASASQADEIGTFLQACAGMAGLFVIQFLINWFRKIWNGFGTIVLNKPLLLMRDGKIIKAALKESRVTESDLMSKLRVANVHDLSQVHAAVLETTGDLSIMHGDSFDPQLLDGVRHAS
jgi:uncharacterized membrane protein YcaP (DUF421 family)